MWMLLLAAQDGPNFTHADKILTFTLMLAFIVLAGIILTASSSRSRPHTR